MINEFMVKYYDRSVLILWFHFRNKKFRLLTFFNFILILEWPSNIGLKYIMPYWKILINFLNCGSEYSYLFCFNSYFFLISFTCHYSNFRNIVRYTFTTSPIFRDIIISYHFFYSCNWKWKSSIRITTRLRALWFMLFKFLLIKMKIIASGSRLGWKPEGISEFKMSRF